MASPRVRTPRTRTPRTPRTPVATETAEMVPVLGVDFLPSVHALLSRLVPDTLGLSGQPSQADGSAAPTTDDAPAAGAGHLEIHQLGPEANGIKIKIQKAKAALKDLPDAERTVEEQQDDIKVLEERVTKMREMLSGLGSNTDEDVEMG